MVASLNASSEAEEFSQVYKSREIENISKLKQASDRRYCTIAKVVHKSFFDFYSMEVEGDFSCIEDYEIVKIEFRAKKSQQEINNKSLELHPSMKDIIAPEKDFIIEFVNDLMEQFVSPEQRLRIKSRVSYEDSSHIGELLGPLEPDYHRVYLAWHSWCPFM